MRSNKILLIYTSNRKAYSYFPIASLLLASVLRKAGYETEIIDTELSDWQQADLSGALCACITTFTGPWLRTALAVAQKIRTVSPGTKIFWGGPHAIALPEVTARHPLADAVCYTEGERVVVELADHARAEQDDYGDIKGIVFRSRSGEIVRTGPPGFVHLDELEFPPYELLNTDLYTIKSGLIYYQSSRGCPHGCRFCRFENHSVWRARSPEKVISDLKRLATLFDPAEIQFIDGDFFIDLHRARQILSMKIDEGLSFTWSGFCRFDTFERLPDEYLSLIKRSGCREIKFGGESGSEKILAYVSKRTKPSQIVAGVERCKQYDIVPTLSFMTGFPIETRDDFLLTVQLIKKIRRINPRALINGLFMLQHLPNTPLTDEIMAKYNLCQPSTLEQWIDHHLTWTTKEDYPWMTAAEYSFRKTMSSIITYLYLSDMVIHMPEKQRANTLLRSKPLFLLIRLVDCVFRNIFVRLRWDWQVAAFPVEWRLWDLFKEKYLKLI